MKRIQTYAEFWPFYVSQHLNTTCRNLHFIGTFLLFAVVGLAVAKGPVYLGLLPLVGYSFAWVGHFVFEKNRPATFKYPLWSLIADFQMFFFILSGKMPAEIQRAKLQFRIQ